LSVGRLSRDQAAFLLTIFSEEGELMTDDSIERIERMLEDVRARPDANLKIAVVLKGYEWAAIVQMLSGEQISELGRLIFDEARRSLANQFATALELAEQADACGCRSHAMN
jgi:hypothetical protein